LGGTVGNENKEEAKSKEGPWLKPKEFLERESHSSWLVEGEERNRRSMGFC